MRDALLAAALLLAGCGQSADDQTANTAAPRKGQVLPITDEYAAMVNMPGMEAKMMQSMQGKPMPHNAAMQRMHERHEGMERIGKAFKATGRTLKSGSPDLALIRSSATTIAQLAAKTTSWFPAGTGPDVGKTRAKPEIWQKPEDFAARTRAFQAAAKAFSATAKAGNVAAIKASFGELGKTCKACHDPYRAPESDH